MFPGRLGQFLALFHAIRKFNPCSLRFASEESAKVASVSIISLVLIKNAQRDFSSIGEIVINWQTRCELGRDSGRDLSFFATNQG